MSHLKLIMGRAANAALPFKATGFAFFQVCLNLLFLKTVNL